MISICIITKNEERNLNTCLERLKSTGYEIVVIDTGSVDASKKTALKYTDKVYDFQWCDDFSAARNHAISKASNDYILMVDSDEFLADFHKEELEKLILSNPEKVGRIVRNNTYVRDETGFSSQERINRLFPKKLYYYTGKVHEQICSRTGKHYDTYPAPVYLDHSGYDGDLRQRKEKSERNIKLLKKMLQESENDPYVLYQLGKSYYYGVDYHEAVSYFEKALEYDLDPRLEYVCDMLEMYGYTLLNVNRKEYALSLESVYKELSYSADFVFMMGHVYMQNELYDKAVAEFLKAVKYKNCKVKGVNSYLAYYNAGVIRECLGDYPGAAKYYDKCGSYSPATEGKSRCKKVLLL